MTVLASGSESMRALMRPNDRDGRRPTGARVDLPVTSRRTSPSARDPSALAAPERPADEIDRRRHQLAHRIGVGELDVPVTGAVAPDAETRMSRDDVTNLLGPRHVDHDAGRRDRACGGQIHYRFVFFPRLMPKSSALTMSAFTSHLHVRPRPFCSHRRRRSPWAFGAESDIVSSSCRVRGRCSPRRPRGRATGPAPYRSTSFVDSRPSCNARDAVAVRTTPSAAHARGRATGLRSQWHSRRHRRAHHDAQAPSPEGPAGRHRSGPRHFEQHELEQLCRCCAETWAGRQRNEPDRACWTRARDAFVRHRRRVDLEFRLQAAACSSARPPRSPGICRQQPARTNPAGAQRFGDIECVFEVIAGMVPWYTRSNGFAVVAVTSKSSTRGSCARDHASRL